MAKITFRDLLVKVSNVFASDAYLVFNQYFIAGPESASKNGGFFICKLTPDMMELCSDSFDNSKIIFFSNIKKAKDNLEEYTSEITDKKKFELIKDIAVKSCARYTSIEDWKSFNFDEETVKKIFKNGETIDLFNDDEKIDSTVLSKSMLPLVSEKNVTDLYYSTQSTLSEDGVKFNHLTLSFDFTMFQLYMDYIYLSLN